VDINAVAPGAINTRLTDEVIAKGPAVSGKTEYDAALKQKANGGSPIAKLLGLVDWMLSAKSDGLTGRLISAPWDPWAQLDAEKIAALSKTDVFTLRRIVAAERGLKLE
jgi:NAD(P)-dependent dehydrogenase (short-subunit alcohol dehydrogenase family)